MESAFRYKPKRPPFDQAVDPARCAASVAFGGRMVTFRQCCQKHLQGSEWCGNHSLEAFARRKAETEERYRLQREKDHARYARIDRQAVAEKGLGALAAVVEEVCQDMDRTPLAAVQGWTFKLREAVKKAQTLG